jgi:hypothetical protein
VLLECVVHVGLLVLLEYVEMKHVVHVEQTLLVLLEQSVEQSVVLSVEQNVEQSVVLNVEQKRVGMRRVKELRLWLR